MTLPDRLRSAIADAHTAIEATPMAVAMIDGTVTREAYGDWLVDMHHLHGALEDALADCPLAVGLFDPVEMTRSRLIDRDRAVFPTDPLAVPHESITRLAAEFAEWRAVAPWKLIAPLYVLEGSRMGSMVLVRHLSRAFGIAPQAGAGLDYHLDGIATRPQKWGQFRAKLATVPLTTEQQADVCAAAVAVMEGLHERYSAVPAAAE